MLTCVHGTCSGGVQMTALTGFEFRRYQLCSTAAVAAKAAAVAAKAAAAAAAAAAAIKTNQQHDQSLRETRDYQPKD